MKDKLFIVADEGCKCSICFDKDANMILKCRHLTVCDQCVIKLSRKKDNSVVANRGNDYEIFSQNTLKLMAICYYYIFMVSLIWLRIIDHDYKIFGIHVILQISCSFRGLLYLILFGIRIITVSIKEISEKYTLGAISIITIYEICTQLIYPFLQ
jgi:hypothetical protein